MSDKTRQALEKLRAQRALVAEAADLFARMDEAGLHYPHSLNHRGRNAPADLIDLAGYYALNQPKELQLTCYQLEPGEDDKCTLLIKIINIGKRTVTVALTLHDQNGEPIGVEMRFVILASDEEAEVTFEIPAGQPLAGSAINIKATTGLEEPYAMYPIQVLAELAE